MKIKSSLVGFITLLSVATLSSTALATVFPPPPPNNDAVTIHDQNIDSIQFVYHSKDHQACAAKPSNGNVTNNSNGNSTVHCAPGGKGHFDFTDGSNGHTIGTVNVGYADCSDPKVKAPFHISAFYHGASCEIKIENTQTK